jgi:hypothetical protein
VRRIINEQLSVTKYFHGDNGAGLGASHQTGWTGLIAPLLDLFGRIDAKTVLDTKRGQVIARVVREQVGGEKDGREVRRGNALCVKSCPISDQHPCLSFESICKLMSRRSLATQGD